MVIEVSASGRTFLLCNCPVIKKILSLGHKKNVILFESLGHSL